MGQPSQAWLSPCMFVLSAAVCAILLALSPRAYCAVLVGWQAGGQAAQPMPTQLPIERQRYGHNVSDRLAASTAPPFLLLWPEINHKYPPGLRRLLARPPHPLTHPHTKTD